MANCGAALLGLDEYERQLKEALRAAFEARAAAYAEEARRWGGGVGRARRRLCVGAGLAACYCRGLWVGRVGMGPCCCRGA